MAQTSSATATAPAHPIRAVLPAKEDMARFFGKIARDVNEVGDEFEPHAPPFNSMLDVNAVVEALWGPLSALCSVLLAPLWLFRIQDKELFKILSNKERFTALIEQTADERVADAGTLASILFFLFTWCVETCNLGGHFSDTAEKEAFVNLFKDVFDALCKFVAEPSALCIFLFASEAPDLLACGSDECDDTAHHDISLTVHDSINDWERKWKNLCRLVAETWWVVSSLSLHDKPALKVIAACFDPDACAEEAACAEEGGCSCSGYPRVPEFFLVFPEKKIEGESEKIEGESQKKKARIAV
jgi:hypothetical protein